MLQNYRNKYIYTRPPSKYLTLNIYNLKNIYFINMLYYRIFQLIIGVDIPTGQ